MPFHRSWPTRSGVSPFLATRADGPEALLLPRPGDEDRVLLLSDDLDYPPDYAETLLRHGRRIGLAQNVVGFDGWADGLDGPRRYASHRRLGFIRGAARLAPETMLLLGRNLPARGDLDPGLLDDALARWFHTRDLLPWALPRDRDWLPPRLSRQPDDLPNFPHQGRRLQDWRTQT